VRLETQLRQVVAGIDSLASWFAKYRPDCRSVNISIRRTDWKAIIAHPDEARAFGFIVSLDSITYHGIALSPTDCGASHVKSMRRAQP
jgi:hypothetical protein